jgi:U3 small nucleolar RNA-associated protein 4
LYNLDTLAFHASLPVLDSPHLTAAFHPTTPTLVVACASNHFYVFDVDDKKLSDWSREHGAALPRSLVSRHEKVTIMSYP